MHFNHLKGLLLPQEIENRRQLYKERGSKLGAQLSESTTKRVIILVLIMLCVIPLLTYNPVDNQSVVALDILHWYNTYGTNETKQVALDTFMATLHRFLAQ